MLAEVLEGETRPRDEVTCSLRDENPQRAGKDSCRGKPSKGESEVGLALSRFLHQAYAPARADLFLLRS